MENIEIFRIMCHLSLAVFNTCLLEYTKLASVVKITHLFEQVIYFLGVNYSFQYVVVCDVFTVVTLSMKSKVL